MRALCSVFVLALVASACDGGSKNDDLDGDGVVARDDCDDADASVLPGAEEVCDGVDNDCDGLIDDDDDDVGAPDWFQDADGDGYGGSRVGSFCEPPADLVQQGDDCDDAVVTIHPGAPELCNGVDDDCDDAVDDADPDLAEGEASTWYADNDGDGFGNASNFVTACEQPEGYVAVGTDCDDSDDGADRYPGAPEICDGKDNDCDLEDGLLVDDEDPDVDLSTATTWYPDADGDGFGAATGGVPSCTPPAGTVDNDEDCDDDDGDAYPGNTEVCDGDDDDCDGYVDGDDWMFEEAPYRVIVDVLPPSGDVDGPPVAVDVDFGEALTTLGDASGLDAASIAVAWQDCDAGLAATPADWFDDVAGLFTPAPLDDPLGDGFGTVAFRFDTDGDLTTEETLPSDVGTVRAAIYFGSASSLGGTPPAPTSPLTVSAGGGATGTIDIDTGVSLSTVDASVGGALTQMGMLGRDSLAAQDANVFGNGIFFAELGGGGPGSGWTSIVDASTGASVSAVTGDVFTLVTSEGTASNPYGSFDYTYRWVAVAGRPELYSQITYTLASSSNVGPQGLFWSPAVRPWQIDNAAVIATGSGSASEDVPGYRWVHGSYGPDGLFLGYRTMPSAVANPVATADGRYLALAGQDVDASPSDNQVTLPAGTNILDHTWLVAMPHTQPTPAAQAQFLRLIEGVEASVSAAEAR